MFIGTNFPSAGQYNETLQRLINGGANALDAFKTAGLDYVELSLKKDTIDRPMLEADITRLQTHRIGVNLHPYFNCRGFGTGREHPNLRQNCLTTLEVAQHIAGQEGRTVVINFHAAESRAPETRADLTRHSLDFFGWLMEQVDRLQADVMITMEHQLPPAPGDTRLRIGDTYAELLALRQQLEHDRLYFCWDMGHSVMQSVYYKVDFMPPVEFLKAVRHVHIHDVEYQNPRDHRRIGTGQSPLRDFVQGLLKVGYAGGFTMEYDTNEFFGPLYAAFLVQSREALLALTENQPVEN